MPKPTKGARLGGSPAHERLILANLATAAVPARPDHDHEAKARRLRPLAEKLITKAKKGDIAQPSPGAHGRPGQGRRPPPLHRDRPALRERPGGYTRITKIGPRKGDSRPHGR